MSDGEQDNLVSCDDGVCVGSLCHVIDGVWAAMPPHWHDDCGC